MSLRVCWRPTSYLVPRTSYFALPVGLHRAHWPHSVRRQHILLDPRGLRSRHTPPGLPGRPLGGRLAPATVPRLRPRTSSRGTGRSGVLGASRGDVGGRRARLHAQHSLLSTPHSAPVKSLATELVAFDPARPEAVNGAFSLYEIVLNRVPQTVLESRATWSYDPDGSYASTRHIFPFGREIQNVMEPAVSAGAAGFIGVLRDYPGDSNQYYVPYDAIERPIPGVWISGGDGNRLRELLSGAPLRVKVSIDSVREMITAHNIVGELPGADEEMVIIGSHHDGPWASAVEDGSGIALVLAQAAYWSQVPQAERPHRLLFLLNAGHMAGGAGQRTFVEEHDAELESVVLEFHLEHAAIEFSDETGELAPTGSPESRWWFTSLIPRLQDAVRSAIEAEALPRSLVVPATSFDPKPPTDR